MNTPTPFTPPVEILIAEDSPTQAQRLKHLLQQQGYLVTHAANGRLALAAAQHHPPSLIISDVVMPEMDGYELCRRVKADANLAGIPVILTTTLSDPQQVLHSLECGADNFIAKPYDGPYLLGRVQYALHHRRGQFSEQTDRGTEIVFDGQRHFITADRAQILHLLISSYDAAFQRNQELDRAHDELSRINTARGAAIAENLQAATALRAAHAELGRVNAELAHASRLKDEFLANMSHELRTPLNAILGLSEMLLEQHAGPLTPRQVRSVTTVFTSGQHLLALINDILDLSKIEAGKLELNVAPIPVAEFCQSCLEFVRTQARQKTISVEFEPDGRVQVFSADPKHFKQVLVNLLTNAVKFTPPGGRIGLSVAAPAGEEVVRFTVWDTGIGIAPADAPKLFRAFTQIDSGLNREQEGTGLGLALVAKLVELHGGSVALASEPGRGSRFSVTLPWAATPAAPPPPQFFRLTPRPATTARTLSSWRKTTRRTSRPSAASSRPGATRCTTRETA
jgi:signal transduction histidine kinase